MSPVLDARGQMRLSTVQQSPISGAARLTLAAWRSVAFWSRPAAAARRRRSGHARRSAGGGGGTVKVALLLPMTASGNTPARRQGAEAGGRACAVRFRQSRRRAGAEGHQGTPDGARAAAQSAIAGGRRADHRSALRPGGHGRGAGGAPGQYSDDRLLQRRERRRQRRLSPELPRRARRAAHRLLRDVARESGISRCWCRNRLTAASPKQPSPKRSPKAAARPSVRATFPAQRRQRHGRAGAADRQRHQVGPADRCACSCLPGREDLPALAPLLASSDVTGRACSSSAPGNGTIPASAARRRWSAAGIRRRIRRAGANSPRAMPRPMARRRRASRASPMTPSASPCRCRKTRRASATPTAQLTRGSGFSGVDGLFRLLARRHLASAASPSSKCAKAARRCSSPRRAPSPPRSIM